MTNIEQWNVIFLLSSAIYANEELFAKVKLPESCSMRHGFWAFDANSVDPYVLDFTESGRLQQIVQPIGAVVICMQHPVGTSPSPNYVSGDSPLPLVFQDLWSEALQPSEVDPLERSPSELSRLVDSYLPRGWGLVACSMSAIPTILLGDFQGSEIIIIDDCTERTRFLYDELCNSFQEHILTTETACRTSSAPDIIQDTKEAIGEERQEDDDEEEQTLNERLPRLSGSKYSLTDNSSTNEESSTDEEVDKSPTRESIPSMQPRQALGPSQSEPGSEIHERVEGTGSDMGPILPSVPRSGLLEDIAAF